MGSAIVAVALWAIQNGPALIKLGADAASLVGVAKDAVDDLESGNHVPPDQIEALRASVASLEAAWAAEVARAQAELEPPAASS
jgi:hypothetical protein